MDRWTRRLQEGAGDTARSAVSQLSSLSLADSEDPEALSRTLRLAERVVWIIDNCDAMLLPTPTIEQVENTVAGAAQYLSQQPVEQRNAAQVINVVATNLEGALVLLGAATIPLENASAAESVASASRSFADLDEVRSTAVDSFIAGLTVKEQATSARLDQGSSSAVELTNELDALRAEVATIRGGIAGLTTQFQADFTSEQGARETQFRNLLADRNKDADDRLARWRRHHPLTWRRRPLPTWRASKRCS